MEEPSAAVCSFIDAFIASIDDLRVLLLQARQPEREWTAAELAQGTALAEETVTAALQRLVAAGLIAASPSATYRYAPRATEFHEMVQELIELDNRRPVTLIRLVYSRKSSSAQAFADAFRLRRS